MVTGHRPDKCGGYNENNPLRTRIRSHMRTHLENLQPTLGITGMALGSDQDFARCCIEIGLPFLAAVPFLFQESKWLPEAQKRYFELLDKAKEVVYVSLPGYTPQKMLARNHWMIEAIQNDGIVLAVYNGDQKGGTAHTYNLALQRGRKIIRINPNDIRQELSLENK